MTTSVFGDIFFNVNNKLLTPKDVAELLNISVRTVYDNAKRLGGFYPFGLRVLRFSPEAIHEHLEGQITKVLRLQVPVSAQGLGSKGIQNALGSKHHTRKAPAGSQGQIKTDPNRHGL